PAGRVVDHRRRADDRARHACARRLLCQRAPACRAHRAVGRAGPPHRSLRLLPRPVPDLALAAHGGAAAGLRATSAGDSSISIKTATLNHVATIEIAQPDKKNAITGDMYRAMGQALRAANDDAEVRAVLITGQ